MWIVCVAQLLIVTVVAIASWGVSGGLVAGAVALGGFAVVVPNALFAARFWWATRTGRMSPSLFFAGEALKIMLTIALLALVHRVMPAVSWPGMILGLGAAAFGPVFLMPLIQRHP